MATQNPGLYLFNDTFDIKELNPHKKRFERGEAPRVSLLSIVGRRQSNLTLMTTFFVLQWIVSLERAPYSRMRLCLVRLTTSHWITRCLSCTSGDDWSLVHAATTDINCEVFRVKVGDSISVLITK